MPDFLPKVRITTGEVRPVVIRGKRILRTIRRDTCEISLDAVVANAIALDLVGVG